MVILGGQKAGSMLEQAGAQWMNHPAAARVSGRIVGMDRPEA